MSYIIHYIQGNGYLCGCCRKTYDQEVELATKDEVIDWLINLYVEREMPSYEDNDDRSIDRILFKSRELKEFDNFEDDYKNIIESEIQKRKNIKIEHELEYERRRLEKNIKSELSKLEKLINKYPEKANEYISKTNKQNI